MKRFIDRIRDEIIMDWKDWRTKSFDYVDITGESPDTDPKKDLQNLSFVITNQKIQNDIYEKKTEQFTKDYEELINSKRYKFRMIPTVLEVILMIVSLVGGFFFIGLLTIAPEAIAWQFPVTLFGLFGILLIIEALNNRFKEKENALEIGMKEYEILFGLSTLYLDFLTHRSAYLLNIIEKENSKSKKTKKEKTLNETIHQSTNERKNRRGNSERKKRTDSRSQKDPAGSK